jgi:hypothetical protein
MVKFSTSFEILQKAHYFSGYIALSITVLETCCGSNLNFPVRIMHRVQSGRGGGIEAACLVYFYPFLMIVIDFFFKKSIKSLKFCCQMSKLKT